MKQILSMLIAPVIVGLVVVYFSSSFNKKFVDLRYTISEKIPTKYVESSTAETVQQLVVKNNGNISAEKIQIKIKGVITEYDVLKNSVSDNVDEHYSNGSFEALYPSLPPGAYFSYIFKTNGIGLTKNFIGITHDKGTGTEALTSDFSSTASQVSYYVSIAASVFYLLLLAIQGRSMAINRLESSRRYTGFYDYLSKLKPFYLSQERWDLIRRKYIEGMSEVKSFYSEDIEDLENYKILNQDKPVYLSVDEWELLKVSATKYVVDFIVYSIKTNMHYNNPSRYFEVKKPSHFPSNKWKEITEDVNKNYVVSRKLNERFYIDVEDIIKELNAGMPNGMSAVYWMEYKEYLLKRYYVIIYRDMLRQREPLAFLTEFDLSILDKDQRSSLLDFAYEIQLSKFDNVFSSYDARNFLEKEKPVWMKGDDLSRYLEKSKEYIHLAEEISKYKFLLESLHDILKNIPLKEKPNGSISDEEWGGMIKIESKISAVVIKIEEDKARLKIDKENTQNLKSKILKQLEVVNNLFSDPGSIDRIELYDNPFSEGNFKNLKELSNLLEKQ